jgi:hypothetical protein
MTYEVKGYLTIDAEDYCGEIEVHTDVRGILELMEHNDISTDEVMMALGDNTGVVMDDVLNFISVDADHSQLYQMVMASFEKIQADYTNVKKEAA